MITVADVVAALERRYPPALAASWDHVGLVCGHLQAPVSKVMFTIDVTLNVAQEAASWGADMLVAHHPLLFRPVDSIAANTDKGAVLHALIAARVALFTAHTNADVAPGGVADALAATLGLQDPKVVVAAPLEASKLVTFVPQTHVNSVLDALSGAGAGHIGEYSRCAFTCAGEGTFIPTSRANPTIRQAEHIARVPEVRVEMIVPTGASARVVAALRRSHPYEEPAFDIVALANRHRQAGTGRIGTLRDPMLAREFAAHVSAQLPTGGAQLAGDSAAIVERVAVLPGAGASDIPAATAAGAHAIVTADIGHHVALEHLERCQVAGGGPVLISVTHWACEWPWLNPAAATLASDLPGITTRLSRQVTDPWSQGDA